MTAELAGTETCDDLEPFHMLALVWASNVSSCCASLRTWPMSLYESAFQISNVPWRANHIIFAFSICASSTICPRQFLRLHNHYHSKSQPILENTNLHRVEHALWANLAGRFLSFISVGFGTCEPQQEVQPHPAWEAAALCVGIGLK